MIEEIDLKYVACGGFYKDNNIKSWGFDRLSTDTFKQLTEKTIKLKMELVDVFDVFLLID